MDRKDLKKVAIGAGGVAIAAAAAAAATAVLSNKETRRMLSKKANQALEIVSRIAQELEKGAQGSLRVIERAKKDLGEGEIKSLPKKIKVKKKE